MGPPVPVVMVRTVGSRRSLTNRRTCSLVRAEAAEGRELKTVTGVAAERGDPARIRSGAPAEEEVEAAMRYLESGAARLQVRFSFPLVQLSGAASTPAAPDMS